MVEQNNVLASLVEASKSQGEQLAKMYEENKTAIDSFSKLLSKEGIPEDVKLNFNAGSLSQIAAIGNIIDKNTEMLAELSLSVGICRGFIDEIMYKVAIDYNRKLEVE